MMAAVDLEELFELAEFERLAVERMSEISRINVQGGAGGAPAANEAAWKRWSLLPRALVDVSRCETSTTVLGREIALPVMVAPSGMHGLLHPDAEVATGEGSRSAGTMMVLSTYATKSPQEVGAVVGAFWMQLYFARDRGFVQEVVQRAAAAGATALCITVDLPVMPWHWNSAEMRALWSDFATRPPSERLQHFFPDRDTAVTWSDIAQDPALMWSDLEWLRTVSPLPIVLKGIMTATDAELAVAHGVSGIVVSNHGGQALEHAPATADVLPGITEAVEGRLEILVDGGIRSGADVFRALALGARAVLIGRPALWGLTLAGADGVARVLSLLKGELETLMGQTGACTVPEIDRTRIRLHEGIDGRRL